MKLGFAIFAWFLPLDFKSSKWLHQISGLPGSTTTTVKDGNVDKSKNPSPREASRIRKVCKFVEDLPVVRVPGSNARLGQQWSGAGLTLLIVLAALSLSIRPFHASDSYSWYCLLVVATYYVWDRLKKNTQDALIFIIDDLQLKFFRSLPWRYLSRQYGRLSDQTIPRSLRPYLYKFLVFLWSVNMKEAVDQVLDNYETMGSLFRRAIRTELRPIHPTAQVVSPADGKVLQLGCSSQGLVEQVKGVSYSLKNFLGPDFKNGSSHQPLHKYARHLMRDPKRNTLYSCVIYLSPSDYHRFHSPAEWRMEHRRHFVGDLLSVNPRLTSWIPGLFVLNERVVLSGTWRHGFFSMTAVGATNVGSIVVYGDEDLRTNVQDSIPGTYFDRKYDSGGVPFSKGDSVGEFRLGSTVVLIFEAPKNSDCHAPVNQTIKYGQPIAI